MEKIYKAQGRFDKAIEISGKDVTLQRERVDLTDKERKDAIAYSLRRLGMAHAEYGKGIKEARRIYKEVWEKYPGMPSAFWCGYELASKKERAKAESMIEKVWGLLKESKPKTALKTLDKAVKKYPLVLQGRPYVEDLRMQILKEVK